tara:strand:+ start:98 stop:526 length:429 start_codon:yes stop_codon:yes gene_type:complete
MIKYKLICKSCEFSFDSWFSSSEEYEKLKKKKFLDCHNCNSKEVEKTLMAPKLINKSENEKSQLKIKNYSKINKKIREYQKFIKNNFKYVGNQFAYEARSIHYNDKKSDKGIFGTASKEEMKELREEGIDAEMIPWIEDKNN